MRTMTSVVKFLTCRSVFRKEEREICTVHVHVIILRASSLAAAAVRAHHARRQTTVRTVRIYSDNISFIDHRFFLFSMFNKAILLSAVALGSAEYQGLPQTWSELHQITGRAEDDSMLEIFAKFKETYGKTYATESTENFHFKIFAERVKEILDFNSYGKQTYRKGITRFADLTSDMRQSYVMAETHVTDEKPKASPNAGTPVSKPLQNAGDARFCDLSQFQTSVKDQVGRGALSLMHQLHF